MTFCADARENFFRTAFFFIPFILNTFVQILECQLKIFHALKYHWTLKSQISGISNISFSEIKKQFYF